MFRITWRAARVNRGLTLEDAARLSCKSVDTVYKYEKDSSHIPYDLMQLWLKLYEVPSELIYCGLESDLIGNFS
jgi:transcriptional regulator with XRE-family HTH domain